ncbi:MAG: response regulator, partial [Myxococcales bacterium]|nr:response regulator [Myxococcales bacterium]
APELLPRIFGLFVQAEESLARAQGGLGIGLKLVRVLVAMHGGRVEAYSEGLGRGSEFVIRLPVVEKPAQTAAQPPGRPPVTVSRRILVVDDNHDAADLLAEVMHDWGHEVRVARDGPSALSEMEAFAPDVVLLDIGLPGMDGYEVARRIRAAHPAERVRLLALTGYGADSDRERARSAGFDRHLVKPVELAELQRVL